jgi:hypothetical protein
MMGHRQVDILALGTVDTLGEGQQSESAGCDARAEGMIGQLT